MESFLIPASAAYPAKRRKSEDLPAVSRKKRVV